jgi:hypothetical protein
MVMGYHSHMQRVGAPRKFCGYRFQPSRKDGISRSCTTAVDEDANEISSLRPCLIEQK